MAQRTAVKGAPSLTADPKSKVSRTQQLGEGWGNLMLIHDYSTDQDLLEIHLVINLETDDKARKIRTLIEDAIRDGDAEAMELKKALREHIGGKMNESKRRMIDAILLPFGGRQ